ncbi:MAG TPA: DNA cytosine methyltransferase [Candidatus Dormibacteraeota bacterium]|nr:DNA cytosine methyltransferase [Candidatus Dormibacteraeota bacterium]
MGRKPSRLSATDLFCGAGGSSIGAEAAGVQLAMGINHWVRAIETHSTNFPHADHDCRDVSDQHPSRYPSTHLLLASPECTNYSQAKGRKRDAVRGQLALGDFEPLPAEAEERSRATMWDVVRFAEHHGYEAIVVENVVDAWDWALLPAWFQAMEALGYAYRPLFLNSMFFNGVPQSRDRLYVVFWKRGNRAPDLEHRPGAWCWNCEREVHAVQAWKRAERRFGRFRQQYVYACPTCTRPAAPYVWPAAAAIDWSLKGERIGDRRKPLAAATMARIQAGIERYWLRPGIFDVQRDPKLRDATTEPLPTQTGRQSQALYIPLLAHLRGTSSGHMASSVGTVGGPMRTVSAGGNHHGVIEAPEPLYVKNFGPPAKAGPMSHPVSEPLGSVTATDHHGLLVHPASGGPGRVRTTGEPMPTQVTETRAMLVQAAGNAWDRAAAGGYARVKTPAEPLWTQSGTAETALVETFHSEDIPHPAMQPMRTLAGENHHALVTPAGGTWRDGTTSTAEPLPTRTSTENDGLAEPPPAFLTSYYRTAQVASSDDPMHTLTGHDRHGLAVGPVIAIEDCLFRMLEPHEIGRGMAFPDAYVVVGNKRERVRQYGQAVTPPVLRWIVGRIVESLA